MDLLGSSRTKSLGGNYYGLVIVDDYSWFTWTLFIATKDNVYLAFKKFGKVIQNEKGCRISTIKSDHGGKFQNEDSINSVRSNELSITFLHLELHSRIEWWRGRIDHWRSWPGHC